MKINIQSLSFNASGKLTDFTLDKVAKLELFTDRITQADVVLRADKSDSRDNKFCEIRLGIPGNDLFASKRQPTFEEAVTKTVEALRHQLLTWKQKAENRSNTQTADSIEGNE